MNLPEELTVAQAAKAIGLQRYSLRDAIHRGELSARQQKIPGGFMYLIPTEALKDFGRRRGIRSSVLGLEPAMETKEEEVSPHVEVEQTEALASFEERKETSLDISQLLRTLPQWEQRMGQIVEQIVEVQADVLGLKKGFHQHLSKVEGRVINLQQGVNGELRVSMERLRNSMNQGLEGVKSGMNAWQQSVDSVFDDMRSTVQEVAASQSDAEMRQAFVHKLSVDNQSTMGEVKKLMVEVNEAVMQMVGTQHQSSEAIERRLEDVKSSVDGVRRSVERSTEMIIKWRQKVQRDQNNRGVKGWLNRLWGRSPALTK